MNLKNRIAKLSKAIESGDGGQRLRYLRDREKTLERLIGDLPIHEQFKYHDAMIALHENGTSVPREDLHPSHKELGACPG